MACYKITNEEKDLIEYVYKYPEFQYKWSKVYRNNELLNICIALNNIFRDKKKLLHYYDIIHE